MAKNRKKETRERVDTGLSRIRRDLEDFSTFALDIHVIILYLIILVLIVAAIIVFVDGTYSIVSMIYSFLRHEQTAVTMVIVSALAQYLLAVVLFILGFGLHNSLKEEEGPRGLAAIRSMAEIQTQFISMIITTLFVILLQKILEPENVDDVVKIGITSAIIVVSAAIFIWCSNANRAPVGESDTK